MQLPENMGVLYLFSSLVAVSWLTRVGTGNTCTRASALGHTHVYIMIYCTFSVLEGQHICAQESLLMPKLEYLGSSTER